MQKTEVVESSLVVTPRSQSGSIMMMQRLLLTTLCLLCTAEVVEAQRQRRLSIEGTAGLSNVHTEAAYKRPSTVIKEGLVAIRLRNGAGHSPLVAAAGSTFHNYTDLNCRVLPDGSCMRNLPTMSSSGMLIGWEVLSSDGASLRLLAGPAGYRSNLNDPRGPLAGEIDIATSGGHQARIDLSTPHMGWLAVVASFRWSHLASFLDGEVDYLNLGVGVRLR